MQTKHGYMGHLKTFQHMQGCHWLLLVAHVDVYKLKTRSFVPWYRLYTLPKAEGVATCLGYGSIIRALWAYLHPQGKAFPAQVIVMCPLVSSQWRGKGMGVIKH
jgi:hypothetical protein